MKGADLTRYADPAQMRAWIERALPGQKLVYADGPGLDSGAEAPAVARTWATECRAILTQVRFGEGFRYLATKRAAAAVPMARPAIARDMVGTPEGEMLRLLGECAAAGMPCPSYAELAEALDLRNRFAARHVMGKLADAGHIAIANDGEHKIVTIAGSGLTTAGRS